MNRLTICVLAAVSGVALSSDIPAPRPVDVAGLVRQLGSEDYAEREEASRRLSSLSVDEPPLELLAALNSGNPEVRNRARQALASLKEHIVRERERAAIALLPRQERFARRGQIDLYIASTAASNSRAEDNRVWIPASEIGVRAVTEADMTGDRKPGCPPSWKDFPTYRNSCPGMLLTRTDSVYTRPKSKAVWFYGEAIQAAGVADGSLHNSLAISRGPVSLKFGVLKALILATGDVTSGGDLVDSVVICDGDVLVKESVLNSLVIARGQIKVGGTSDTSYLIAGGIVTIAEHPKPIPKVADPVHQSILDTRKVVIEERTSKPLGYITFFELSTVGVEVNVMNKAVKVAAVEKAKPFADAGVWVGDIVMEVNGKKPDSAESLRRLLRDALAIGDATVKLNRGGKTETVKVSLPE